ncbi:LOW QUALITY PROTEIN: calmodulin-like protein 6 [Dama dama]
MPPPPLELNPQQLVCHSAGSSQLAQTWQSCYGCLVEEPQWAGWVAQRELGQRPRERVGRPLDPGISWGCARRFWARVPTDGAPVTGQIQDYKGVSEMFDEEGRGQVKMDELEQLMSFLGINSTKSELASTAKDVDRVKKGLFNCSNFLALMGGVLEKAQNQEGELRAAFCVFDKEAKGYIDWDMIKYVLMNVGEPLKEVEAEQMMKEADENGDGTLDYEGEQRMGPGTLEAGQSGRAADLSLCSQSSCHDD